MTPQDSRADDWALTGVVFAAVMMFVIGLFQFFGGIGAIVQDDVYVIGGDYAYSFSVTAWGWIHLVIGAVMVAAGYALFRRYVWGGVVAIVLASLSAVSNFLFLPYAPFWSLVVIALNVFVIWSITRPGAVTA
jgi:hypothetical protein